VRTPQRNGINAISSLTMYGRFIEENNAYKNAQKEVQRNQRPLPGMPSQDVMAYWGNIESEKLYMHGWMVTLSSRIQIRDPRGHPRHLGCHTSRKDRRSSS
jgi:hypothetical protein